MFRFLLLSLMSLTASCFSASNVKQSIVVDNRVLATVRDQIITVQDVVKKLDMLFYQQFPQHRGSAEARYEFYQANWKTVFEDLVNRLLVLSWADERQFQVSNGDVRQELEEVFGPDVMINLYESGFSLNEVQEMIRADILLRRLLYFYVRLPVLAGISPSRVRALYEEKRHAEGCAELLHWRSITVKAKQGECAKKEADAVFNMLQKEKISIADVCKKIPATIEVTASEQFQSVKNELAPHTYEILSKLPDGTYSEPASFVGKQNGQKGWRFYTVDKREQVPLPPIDQMEEALRAEIAQPEIAAKTKELFDSLHKEYQVNTVFSQDELIAFQPFTFRPMERQA